MKTIKEIAKELNKPESEFLVRMDGRIEWVCEHGVGHTVYADPELGDWGWVHGCDGCCGCCGTDVFVDVLPLDEPTADEVGIDEKIAYLLDLTTEFIFPEYYTHTKKMMWKILNEYTTYGQEKNVLCGVDEGIDKALDLAIEYITNKKDEFFNGKN